MGVPALPSHVISMAARAARFGADLLLPPQCLLTGEALAGRAGLSAEAWSRLRFIDEPFCASCGLPFAHDEGEGAICGECASGAHDFDRARAVFVYDDVSKKLVLDFKHGDRLDGAPVFAAWLARAGSELLADADYVAPTPLHWMRLFKRKYNQAALLAKGAAKAAGRPYAPDMLVRKKRTAVQGGLSRDARRRNVQGAFAVNPVWAERCEKARIVLLDDVFTTGATVNACVRVLRKAGAARVDVLTLARVVRDGGGAI